MDEFVSWRDINYERVARLGDGGIGQVFHALAKNGPNKGVLFAVKVFCPDSKEKEDWKRSFMREVHVLRDCNHPAIVKVYDEGMLADGRPFFVMEYLPKTLWDAMKEGTLGDVEKISIVMQLLSALDYLSRRDPYVVHRDIKPKNIFLKSETWVLGDFGLVFQDVGASITDQAKGGGVIPEMAQMYRTPELVEYYVSGAPPPAVSDVFQLGLVAAELFTGENPLVHAGPKAPVKIRPLAALSSVDAGNTIRETIRSRLEEMLVIETENRHQANVLLPRWIELYSAWRQQRGR